jgi:RNA polymerase sigma-70 factor, ECF subfamily
MRPTLPCITPKAPVIIRLPKKILTLCSQFWLNRTKYLYPIPGLISDLMFSSLPLEQSDEELITRTKQGDSDAYGILYDRYVDALFRYIYYRLRDEQEAQDLTEETFIKVWETVKEKGTGIYNFKAWLYRIAHNLVVDHYRKSKEILSLDNIAALSDGQPHPENIIQDEETQVQLMNAVAQLEPELQQLITLRFGNGYSHRETAEIMNVKEGHLRVMQHRALKKLYKTLSKEVEQS